MHLPSYHQTNFVGRIDELTTLEHLFNDVQARLVTLTGTGGIGKTRLALQFAQSCSRDTTFVDASRCSNDLDLVSAVAEALGFETLAYVDGPVRWLGLALERSGALVLVLDNLEHLVEDAASVVARWLELTTDLTILTTSRIRLNLAAEHLLTLKPFPQDNSDGVTLFLERTQALAPSKTAPDPEELERIRAIVACTEGLPLAIELAAARAGLLGTKHLLEHLNTSFRVLRSNARDTPARHQTLDATLTWSWDLMSPHQRTALSHLAVFEGMFTIPDALAVLEPNDDALFDVIEDLRDLSLLALVDDPKVDSTCFHILAHIQHFAWDKLAEEVKQTLLLRHARYFQGRAQVFLKNPDWTLPILLSEVEKRNFAAVLERATQSPHIDLIRAGLVVTQVYNPRRGQHNSVERLLDTLGFLLHEGEQLGIDAHILFDASQLYAEVLAGQGKLKLREREIKRVARLAQDPHEQASVDYLLASQLHAKGQFDAALEKLDSSQITYEAEGDLFNAAISESLKAGIFMTQNNLEMAEKFGQNALNTFRSVGSPLMEAMSTANMAWVHLRQGRADRARAFWYSSLEMYQKIGSKRYIVGTKRALGTLYASTGQFEKAFLHLNDALQQCTLIMSLSRHAQLQYDLGHTYLLMGDLNLARTHTQIALKWARKLDKNVRIHNSRLLLAIIDWTKGDLKGAVAQLELLESDNIYTSHYKPSPSIYRAAILACIDPELAPQELEDPPAKMNAIRTTLDDLVRGIHQHPSDCPELVERAISFAERGLDLSIMLRLFWRALPNEQRLPAWSSAFSDTTLLLSSEESLIRIPGQEPQNLKKQPLLVRLLREMARRRFDQNPGMTADDIQTLLWPGEQILPRAARNRISQSLNRLKKLGLKDRLQSNEGRYTLSGPLAIVPEGFSVR